MPSSVFKTSAEKIQIALDMDRNGNTPLSNEFCFFDGKHNCCRGFITLTASVYHPLLQKQVPLAIMKAEGETTENVELFWRTFNQALHKFSGKSTITFSPLGWCTDMSGAIISGITKVFGEDAKEKVVRVPL